MSAVFDAMQQAVLLSILPWMLIMVTTSAALAYRVGRSPFIGALLGLIPVPFVGWAIVYRLSRGSTDLTRGPSSDEPPTPGLDVTDIVDDWNRA